MTYDNEHEHGIDENHISTRQSRALSDAFLAFLNAALQLFGALTISGRLFKPLASDDYAAMLLTMLSLATFSVDIALGLVRDGPHTASNRRSCTMLYATDITLTCVSVATTVIMFLLAITAWRPSPATLDVCRYVTIIVWSASALAHCFYRTYVVVDFGIQRSLLEKDG